MGSTGTVDLREGFPLDWAGLKRKFIPPWGTERSISHRMHIFSLLLMGNENPHRTSPKGRGNGPLGRIRYDPASRWVYMNGPVCVRATRTGRQDGYCCATLTPACAAAAAGRPGGERISARHGGLIEAGGQPGRLTYGRGFNSPRCGPHIIFRHTLAVFVHDAQVELPVDDSRQGGDSPR